MPIHTDRLNGKKLRIAYNVDQYMVAPDMSGWHASKTLRERAKRTNSRFALRIIEPLEDGTHANLFLFSPRPSVSFSAQLERQSQVIADLATTMKSFSVVIALDRRIYIADIAEGFIQKERFLRRPEAVVTIEALVAQQIEVLVMASGGTLTEAVEALPGVQSLQVDYDLDAKIYRYRRLSTTMLGSGLFHPTPVWISAVLVLAFGSQAMNRHYQALDREALAATERRQLAEYSAYQADFSARQSMHQLADIFDQVQYSGIDLNGLKAFIRERGQLVLDGDFQLGYPHAALQLTDRWNNYSAALTMTNNSWRVRATTPLSADQRSIRAWSQWPLQRLLLNSHYSTQSQFNQVGIASENSHRGAIKIRYQMPHSSPVSLRVLGNELAELPVTLDKVSCKMSMGNTQCTLEATARYAL